MLAADDDITMNDTKEPATEDEVNCLDSESSIDPSIPKDETEVSLRSTTNSGHTTSPFSTWFSGKKASRSSKTLPKQNDDNAVRQTLLDEAVSCDVNLVERTPAKICLVFTIPPKGEDDASSTRYNDNDEYHSSLGISFSKGSDNKILIASIQPGGLLDLKNPLAHNSGGTSANDRLSVLHVGDQIESINGKGFTIATETSVAEVVDYCQALEGDVCMVVRVGQERMNTTGLIQFVLARDKSLPHVQEKEDREEPPSAGFPDLGLGLVKRKNLLCLSYLSSKGIMAKSKIRVVEPGDFIVAMGRMPCSILEPEEANLLFQDLIEHCEDCVSLLIVQASDSEKRWARIRRATVAVGGGTMVGVGSILMVTPLHPVGHAMAMGGVGVLGTEFEAPRRVIKAARDSFRRKDSSSEQGCEDKAASTLSSSTNKEQPADDTLVETSDETLEPEDVSTITTR
jgi:hypothetical protein